MLAQIARFEIRYQLRQPLFWSVFTIFFLLSFGVITVDQVKVGAGGNVAKNSPFALAQLHLVWTLFFMFVTAAFAANVVIRDDETGFGPIVRTTPVRKSAYLYGRFAGAFAMVAACYLSVPLGVFAGSLMPWVDAQTLVPNDPHAYAYAFFFLALPGLLVTSAIFFTLATAVRSIVATWLGVVAFFVAWAAANTLLDDPAQQPLVALLEPFGFAAFSEATRYWTAADRNGWCRRSQGRSSTTGSSGSASRCSSSLPPTASSASKSASGASARPKLPHSGRPCATIAPCPRRASGHARPQPSSPCAPASRCGRWSAAPRFSSCWSWASSTRPWRCGTCSRSTASTSTR